MYSLHGPVLQLSLVCLRQPQLKYLYLLTLHVSIIMAPVKIEVGDFMEYKNKTCLIVEVHNTIHVGYNTYSLLNLETGINTHINACTQVMCSESNWINWTSMTEGQQA